MKMESRRNSLFPDADNPPLSRLFIMGPKTATEDDYRNNFDEFGSIEEIWMVKDKSTGEYKGITYIKYSKASEAADALENMDGAVLVSGTRKIKVTIASSREQGSKRETNEEEKMLRLFITCPKTMTEDELRDYFEQFGDLEYVSIIKDKQTGESKGIAYVKYSKFSHAARALEECDRKYKPVFAEPKKSEPLPSSGRYSGLDNSPMNMPSITAGPSGKNEGYNKLTVIASPDLTKDHLWKLFDVVPGFDYCQVKYEGNPRFPSRAIGEVVYTSSQWAAHAREKLDGLEYPLGFHLVVKPFVRETAGHKYEPMDIAETIAQASSLIQAAGLDPSRILNLGGLSESSSQVRCSVNLPGPKPLAPMDDECVARCFVVCLTGTPLSKTILNDIFCRFGNLIEAYMLNNKNCGYAKYSDKSSCAQAIKTLHGADVNGVRLKVILAEEQRKRPRTDDD